MTVLIDTPLWPKHGTVWAHLVSDRSIAELRAFAEGNGVPSRAFDLDHYDVPVERWDELVAAGAEPVSPRELVRRLAASGLRVTPRERHGRDGPERHHR
ncbi:DUF4031 domain-containing protein [Agromyces sp. NPDC057865]|uniref:DUF4031 domain-containing protein n=1 Tax=Agromyces sp. NPDC057865 TaxID=3346267 RepID=UPI00366CB569